MTGTVGSVPRWREDGPGRLQHAAVMLFIERGYDQVTIAEIAERSGLTRRSFFNHFADKREIFFAGAAAFQAHVVDAIAAAPATSGPLHAAGTALVAAGTGLAELAGDLAPTVRAIITSSTELRERELSKMAALTDAVTDALQQRGVPTRTAQISARVAVTAFTVAYDDWVDNPKHDLATHMDHAITDFRAALATTAVDVPQTEGASWRNAARRM